MEEQPKSIPLIKCRTVQGSFLSLIGAALPLVTVEIAKLPPSTYTRWSSFILGLMGIIIVIYRRTSTDHPPVDGIFRSSE